MTVLSKNDCSWRKECKVSESEKSGEVEEGKEREEAEAERVEVK